MDVTEVGSTFEEPQDQQLHSTLEISSTAWSDICSDASSSTDEEEAPDNETSGQLCEVKALYEGESKCSCCINWVEELPKDIKPSAEEESESRRHALLIRLRRNHSDGKQMALHSIVVQSPLLKSILGEVFEEYSGITTTLKKLVFKAPFHCFFHEWHRLESVIREIKDPICKDHGRLLRKILKSELRETISLSNDLNQNNVITYDYLWSIFKPGIDVYTFEDGYDRIYRLLRTQYVSGLGAQYFQLTVNEVECDGNVFGFSTKSIPIYSFLGTKQVQDLDAFPASRHPRLEEVEGALRKRGEMFRDIHLKPYYYGAYKGTVIDGKHRRNVDGRIVVDPSSHATFTDGSVDLIPFDSNSLKPEVDVSDQTHEAFARFPVPGVRAPRGPMEVTDDLLHLCSAYVRGYCFKIKKWVTFHIDHVREIQWHDGAFDNLVLAGEYKRLIKAFVESHVENKEKFDDMIEGKVSEKLRRPLYAMGAGELGGDAESVEDNLHMILEAAAKWDAVLLLDECDVLLAKRSVDNLGRNSIVAIFLRLLEYYRGMLFMTTNRVEAIDPAFQSRIHLTIRYPSLDVPARRQIWERFVQNSQQESTLKPPDFDDLQSVDVNGREIKNLVKTAQLLASHEKAPLAMEHIRTALSVSRASAQFPLVSREA
ncbi:hypothetical protein AAE478_003315 [Parahypoxylon ruwenzoriense]